MFTSFSVDIRTPRQITKEIIREDVGFDSKIDMNKLDFNLMLTSSENGAFIYDLRNMAKRLFTLSHHSAKVNNCKWSPYHYSMLASCSNDRRVAILDIHNIELPKFTDDFHNTDQALSVLSCFRFNF